MYCAFRYNLICYLIAPNHKTPHSGAHVTPSRHHITDLQARCRGPFAALTLSICFRDLRGRLPPDRDMIYFRGK